VAKRRGWMAAIAAGALTGLLGVRPARAATLVTGGDLATQTWTATAGPYVVTADVHVPAGAMLTIDAGTVIAFAKADALHAGKDSRQVELVVDGALQVEGTASSPVVFRSQSGSPSEPWFGVVIGSDASGASLTGAIIRDAQFGVHSAMTAGTLVVHDVTIRDCSNTGIWVYAGTAAIDGLTVIGELNNGISIGSGITTTPVSATIANTVITKGIAAISLIASGPVMAKIGSTTLDGNHLGIQFVSGGPGSSLEVVDTIVSNDSTFGVVQSQPDAQVTISHSAFYKNAMADVDGTSAGPGCLFANPMFVGKDDWHLQSSSPCLGAGAGGGPTTDRDGAPRGGADLGACEPGGSGAGCRASAGADARRTPSPRPTARPPS
jgi:hypothetical protein